MFSSYIIGVHSTLQSTVNDGKCSNKQDLKAILKFNKMLIHQLSNLHQYNRQNGGYDEENVNENPDEKKLIDLITPIKQSIEQLKSDNVHKKELIDTKQQFVNMVEYINYIHSKLPDDSQVTTLATQMADINRIINKY
jgi:flagellar biosynthesis/type III secretory pathway chaperone